MTQENMGFVSKKEFNFLVEKINDLEKQNDFILGTLLMLSIGMKRGGATSQAFGEEIRKSIMENKS